MTDRDYLWCALHMLLDYEAAADRLCPSCKVRAEEAGCPVCGASAFACSASQNASFEEARYEALSRGELI